MVTKRFLFALVASLSIHAAMLWPAGWWALRTAPVAPPPLSVRLPSGDELVPSEVVPSETPPRAVPPAPTLDANSRRDDARLQALAGRALAAALAALAREEFYPREAIAQGLEGRVVLLLTLDDAGRVTRIEVASSSGHRILDEAARKAAARIGRVVGGRRQVLLPVEFSLE